MSGCRRVPFFKAAAQDFPVPLREFQLPGLPVKILMKFFISRYFIEIYSPLTEPYNFLLSGRV